MNDVVFNVVKNELNWRERIIVRIFKKTFFKFYHIVRISTLNNILK